MDRFLSKVDKTTDCWLWTGYRCSQGYGRFWWKGTMKLAHRVSYELFVAPVGDLCVCHRCDNPRCVNPDHLFLGTKAENVADMDGKGRRRPARGFALPHTKLSPEDRKKIRQEVGPQREVARMYGVSQTTVWRIRNESS